MSGRTLFERMLVKAWPLPDGHVAMPVEAAMGDECPCPACRSDVAGLVPCMAPKEQQRSITSVYPEKGE